MPWKSKLVIFILTSCILILNSKTPVFADVIDDIKDFNKKGAPPVSSTYDTVINITVTPDPQSGFTIFSRLTGRDETLMHEYSKPSKTEKVSFDITTFFRWILSWFNAFNKDAKEIGNENAQAFLDARFPAGVGKQITAKIQHDSELAMNGNQNVLGATPGVYDNAMDIAYPCAAGGNLPFGLGTCDKGQFANSKPNTYPTSTSNSGGGSSGGGGNPPVNVPPGCSDYIPKCYPGSADCLPGNTSKCFIPKKGWCSVDCLKPYFSGSQIKAEKAAQICFRESGGDAYQVTDTCLRHISVDYSIGLFQINLLAHCDASQPTYTWTPPSCKFGNQNELAKCVTKYKNPIENIKYMVQLSNSGTNWKPWSTAGPLYCNIQ